MSAYQDLMTALATRRPGQSAAEDERIVLAALDKHAHELAAQYAAMLRAYPDYCGVMDLAAALILGEDHPHRRSDASASPVRPDKEAQR